MDEIKVLIIDDEQINCDFFEVMLSHLGFNVFSETSGESGLTRIRELSPDIILIDLNLSTMSGMDIIRAIKNEDDYEAFRSIPIILFSSHDDSDEKVEGFELGIEDYITKPFSFAEVLARIRGILKQKELYKQVNNSCDPAIINRLKAFPINELRESTEKIREELIRNRTPGNNNSEDSVQILAQRIGELEDIISQVQNDSGDNLEFHSRLSDMDSRFKKHMQEINNAQK